MHYQCNKFENNKIDLCGVVNNQVLLKVTPLTQTAYHPDWY
jgi:hypothetical protein